MTDQYQANRLHQQLRDQLAATDCKVRDLEYKLARAQAENERAHAKLAEMRDLLESADNALEQAIAVGALVERLNTLVNEMREHCPTLRIAFDLDTKGRGIVQLTSEPEDRDELPHELIEVADLVILARMEDEDEEIEVVKDRWGEFDTTDRPSH